MAYSISTDGTSLTIDSGGNDLGDFNAVCKEIIRKEKSIVIDELKIIDNDNLYYIPDGITMILNYTDFDTILSNGTQDPLYSEKEKDKLLQAAKKSFNDSESIKKLKAEKDEIIKNKEVENKIKKEHEQLK